MMKPNIIKPELDDVLQEFLEGSEKPDSAFLGKLVRKYPHFASELGDFAAEWFVQETLSASDDGSPSLVAESEALESTLVRFDSLSRASALDPSGFPRDPFVGRGASELGQLAESVGLDKTVLAKLRDRKIEVATIPRELTLSLSRELSVPVGVMLSHLKGPAMIPCGASFKTQGKPTAGVKETFSVAIERSQLNQTSKAKWLDLASNRA